MIKYGSTRVCILTKKYAFKIPRLVKFRSFLYGLLANINEVEFSKMKDRRLFPVLFSIPYGFLVVMPRCKQISYSEFTLVIDSDFIEVPFHIPCEPKYDSFGKLNNKIVAIDYGG